jgi:hypothetical protein
MRDAHPPGIPAYQRRADDGRRIDREGVAFITAVQQLLGPLSGDLTIPSSGKINAVRDVVDRGKRVVDFAFFCFPRRSQAVAGSLPFSASGFPLRPYGLSLFHVTASLPSARTRRAAKDLRQVVRAKYGVLVAANATTGHAPSTLGTQAGVGTILGSQIGPEECLAAAAACRHPCRVQGWPPGAALWPTVLGVVFALVLAGHHLACSSHP